MAKRPTDQTICGLTLRQANGKACVCCGRDYSPSTYPNRIHVGTSEAGHKVYACKTCPGADRPNILRQPWCRTDQRPSIVVMRYDNGIQIAHAKIVRGEPELPKSPFAQALIYFNPNSSKAWSATAKQIRQLGRWLLTLANEVERINSDGTPQDEVLSGPSRTTRSGNVRSLDEARGTRRRKVSSCFVEPLPVDDAEAALAEHAAAALLKLEKKFGTRAFHIAHNMQSKPDTTYTARVNEAVPEVVETMKRIMKEIGATPESIRKAKPFPAPDRQEH